MNVFYTGRKSSYIGSALAKRGVKLLDVDILDYSRLRAEISFSKPDVVLHLAGISDPDECEKDYKKSTQVNVDGTHNVADACYIAGVPMVLFSSAYVWGGGWTEYFNRHAEDSAKTPACNAYGIQKSVAEFIVETASPKNKIIRLSHVFDVNRCLDKLTDLMEGKPIDAPTFLYRSFIHLEHFSALMGVYLSRFEQMPQILHLAGASTVSCNTFWREVCNQFGFDKKLVKARRHEKNFPAKRPHNGGLNIDLSVKLGFPQFDYIDGIGRMKNEG